MRAWKLVTSILALGFVALAAHAGPVGERHLVTTNSTAALRDAEHRPQVRVTVWYPAAAGSVEQSIDQGPPGKPLILEGGVAPDAPFANARRRPVILLSHGFGGSARSLAWFGLALARAGYVVVAPDHPGNNGLDKMTLAGALLSWDRAEDLKAALDAAIADPVIGPHMDRARLGVAGFSAGGYTSLVAAGARASPERLGVFCRAHPQDGICMPQKEFSFSQDDAAAAMRSPPLSGEAARAGDDHAIPGIRAVFAIAPAIVQELTPESLERIRPPVAIILGDADPVAPPATNGFVAAHLIPHAELKVLPGVGHYDFIGVCTPAARATIPICAAKVPQGPTHQAAIDMAIAFFNGRLNR
ncbi:MAG TPA: alpha/beta hydrolase [Caulobacteraceae bacterium]|jgi:predicted dienelactone hydrolase